MQNFIFLCFNGVNYVYIGEGTYTARKDIYK